MKTIQYAFARTLPVMAGYLVLGLGFGVLLQANGYGWGWALAMSVFVYAGSMQYLAVDLLGGGASLLAAALMTLTVNASISCLIWISYCSCTIIAYCNCSAIW